MLLLISLLSLTFLSSYVTAEICELFRTYILTRLAAIITRGDWGLCRDDDLLILHNVNGQ